MSDHDLVGEQNTMLMTLRMHASDARSRRPILGDRFAAGLLERLDRKPSRFSSLDGNTPLICTRARLVDDAVRAFLDRHRDAVVLHLGCGLDSRVLRVDPSPQVRWIEVDQEPVMDLRRRLYPPRDGVEQVSGLATDDDVWARVPADRPLLVASEGMLMYLGPTEVHEVVDRLSRHDATLVADTVAPWVATLARWQPAMRAASTGFQSSTADLVAALGDLDRPFRREETALPRETAARTHGALRVFLRAFALPSAGRRAMVLNTVRLGEI